MDLIHGRIPLKDSVFTKTELISLICLFFFITLIKVYLSFSFVSPQVFADEYIYDFNAQIAASGNLFFSNVTLGDAPFPLGYPIFLSIAYFLSPDKITIYHISLILNCLITAAILFPSFLVLKRVCSSNESIIGAFLVTVLPSVTSPSFLLMSENLMVPLFILSIWLVIKSFSSQNVTRWDICLGIVLFMIFFVRTPGISMIFAYFCALAIWSYQATGRKLIIKKGISVISPMIAGYVIWTIDQLIFRGYIPHGYSFSYYFTTLSSSFIGQPLKILSTSIIHIDYLLVATNIVIAFFTLIYFYLILDQAKPSGGENTKFSLRQYLRNTDELFYVTVFIIISGIGLLAFAVLHMINFPPGSLHGRYVDPVIPAIFILGILGIKWAIQRNLFTTKFCCGFMGFLCLSLIMLSLTPFPANLEPNNNSAVFFLYNLGKAPENLIIGIIPLSLFLIIYYFSQSKRDLSYFLLLLVFFSVIFTTPALFWEMQVSQNQSNVLSFCNFLSGVSSPTDRYIWDGTANAAYPDTLLKDQLMFWLGNRLTPGTTQTQTMADGSVKLNIDSEPGNFLITKADYPLPVAITVGEYRIYSLQK